MKITIGDKIYEQTKIKGRLVRKSLEVQDMLEEKGRKFGAKEYDEIISFIVDTFERKFTSDDVLDELESKEIMSVFYDICTEIGGNMGNSVDKLEKN